MLVFCCSKERAIALSDWLYGEGFNVDVLHGDMSQTKRRQVMETSGRPSSRSWWPATSPPGGWMWKASPRW